MAAGLKLAPVAALWLSQRRVRRPTGSSRRCLGSAIKIGLGLIFVPLFRRRPARRRRAGPESSTARSTQHSKWRRGRRGTAQRSVRGRERSTSRCRIGGDPRPGHRRLPPGLPRRRAEFAAARAVVIVAVGRRRPGLAQATRPATSAPGIDAPPSDRRPTPIGRCLAHRGCHVRVGWRAAGRARRRTFSTCLLTRHRNSTAPPSALPDQCG
jgi:hypothetical protein